MTILLFLFGIAVAAGLFFILADILKLPRLSTEKALLSAGRTEKKRMKSDEYCQGGFSNGTVNTLRTSRICKDFQEKQARNQARKINACRIHEVSAVCAYGLHRSAICGAVPLVRGFA